jgi:hypothetical protein
MAAVWARETWVCVSFLGQVRYSDAACAVPHHFIFPGLRLTFP